MQANYTKASPEMELEAFERSLTTSRILVVGAIGVTTLLGWSYLGLMLVDMVPIMDAAELGPGMGALNYFNGLAGLPADVRAAITALCLPEGTTTFGMPSPTSWGVSGFSLVFIMWFMMALAMMLPTAAPMLWRFVKATERRLSPVALVKFTSFIALGYLCVWTGYALVASLAQWGMSALKLLSPMMAPASLGFAGSTLIAAGLYQFTPMKEACLERCRTSSARFIGEWPERKRDALRLGFDQGVLCFGCCWALMSVMFAVGVMNVLWIALLGALMAIEKLTFNRLVPMVVGVVLTTWGVIMLLFGPLGKLYLGG